ncbi:hypothetical protein H6F32_06380 [Anabaena sp. FACHB-1237]|uniref:hypothetical protein n=1 Tax=Anabaena sp. FACHB-1237 TaxID=2692769 RepID=UPI0016812F1F|nr:hypothetical protein [Anabaena sp. FACHB-1237]MBD2137219.1 hypothetical protein [Anabaena sp. FACHB-1237]
MASIKLSQLKADGSELFQDSESFLSDMNDVDTIAVQGGASSNTFGDLVTFSIKGQEFVLLGYSIRSAVELAKSYSHGAHNFY